MDKYEIITKIGAAANLLRSAQGYKGPYVIRINGIDTIVSREEFLDFYIDVTIQDLWDLKESVEESLTRLQVVKKS